MDEQALVVTQQDPFQVMERLDEQQVLDEIKGRALDKLVYEINQGGNVVTGLSLAGVRETVRVMNKNQQARIHISNTPPIIKETPTDFEVMVFAVDDINGGGWWGCKKQAKQFQKRNGELQDDPFALEKALAKAQRNAQRGLIPEYYAAQMIEAFRGNHRKATPPVQHQAQQPAPVVKAQPAPQIEVVKAEPPTHAEVIADEIRTVGRAVANAKIKADPREIQRLAAIAGQAFETQPAETRDALRHAVYSYVYRKEVTSGKDLPNGLVVAMLQRWESATPWNANKQAATECAELAKQYQLERGQVEMKL